MEVQNPTIILPGIKGSSLENFYALQPDTTWSEWDVARTRVFGPQFHDLALDASGQFDAALRVVNRPDGLFPLAYGALANSLRQRRQLPVYVFPYDWRLSITRSAEKLRAFVQQVHRKVSASDPATWSGRIDFVCHSMGGLVFREFLGNGAELDTIGRVAFIAVPHLGSLDAVEAMIRGETTLFDGRKEMRKLARTFPGVYELLPRFSTAVIDAGTGQKLDVFDLRQWQENVTPNGPDGPEVNGLDVLQMRLDEASKVLSALPDPTRYLDPKNMLTIYGSKARSTLVSVRVGRRPPFQRWYDFDGATKGDGDEVVPIVSAVLPGVPAVKLTWGDVSYFNEAAARFLSFHAFMPTLDEARTVIARFLAGLSKPGDLLPYGLPLDRYEEFPSV